MKHEAIAEACVIGVPDPKWSERPFAAVVKKPDQSVEPEDLRGFLRDFAARGLISKFAVPEHVVFLDAMPRTSVGKLDKKVLRAWYADGTILQC